MIVWTMRLSGLPLGLSHWNREVPEEAVGREGSLLFIVKRASCLCLAADIFQGLNLVLFFPPRRGPAASLVSLGEAGSRTRPHGACPSLAASSFYRRKTRVYAFAFFLSFFHSAFVPLLPISLIVPRETMRFNYDVPWSSCHKWR